MEMLAVALLISLVLCLLLGVPYIDFLKKKMIGQYIKELAPESHAQKQGTPTTGGVFIIAAIIILGTKEIIIYLPFIGILSLVTGILSGVVTQIYLKRSVTGKFIETNKIWLKNEKISISRYFFHKNDLLINFIIV